MSSWKSDCGNVSEQCSEKGVMAYRNKAKRQIENGENRENEDILVQRKATRGFAEGSCIEEL